MNSIYSRTSAVLLLFASLMLFSGSGHPASPLCFSGDLDSDGTVEKYCLKNHMLVVTEGTRRIWESDAGFKIDSFTLGDIDNDGKANLVVSLWKKGSFGYIRPFWHKGTDESYKNHLFIYKLQDDSIQEVWCSSDLDRPILSFKIEDVDRDERNELVTQEGEYIRIEGNRYAAAADEQAKKTVWKWNEWGFQLLDE